MIYLPNTTDKLEVATSSAASIDYQSNWVEAVTATLAIANSGRQVGTISSATDTDISGSPASSNNRTVKQFTVRNKDASLACDVTVRYNANGTRYELHKVTLQPGWMLLYIEGLGFFTNTVTAARGGLKNVSVADQSIGASTTAYITGSGILLPASGSLIAGMVLRWRLQVAKTAASTATQTVAVRFGTGQSTSDTARNSVTLDTETAAADEAIYEILATIRGPITSSCIVEATVMVNDNLSTTGFSNTARKAQIRQVTSAAFDITPAGTYAGLSIATGASHALTVRQCHAELLTTGG